MVMFILRLIAFDRRKLVLVDLDLGGNNSHFSSQADCFDGRKPVLVDSD